MKTKLIHIIYISVIAGIVLLQSSMNVLEDELRMEIACKDFIIDILKEKEWRRNLKNGGYIFFMLW